MKTIKLNLLCLAIAAMAVNFVGCSSHKFRLDRNENQITKDGVSVSATSIQIKKNKYFVDLTLLNDSEKLAVFKLRETQCFKGNTTGEFKRAFWNAGVKTFNLEPHQRKTFRAVCEHDVDATGEFRLKFPFSVGKPGDEDEGEGEGPRHKRTATAIEWKYEAPVTH